MTHPLPAADLSHHYAHLGDVQLHYVSAGAGPVVVLLHDHLGQPQCMLVGHDWGGPTAYALAAAHPEAVRKLAVLDVTIPGDGVIDQCGHWMAEEQPQVLLQHLLPFLAEA